MAENKTLFEIFLETKRFSAPLKKAGKDYNKFVTGMAKDSQKMSGNFAKNMRKVSKEINNTRVQFEGWRLSLLFMSQSVKRSFQTILRSSTQTFLKIEQGTTAQGQALIALSAEWEFLKFSIGSAIGEALIPFIPLLVEILQGLTAWINEHPKLTAIIVIFGLVLGVVVGLVSTFGLLVNGLKMAGLISATTGAKASLGTLALGFAKVIFWVLVFLAVVALIAKFAPKSFGVLVEGIGDVVKGLMELNAPRILGGLAKMFIGLVSMVETLLDIVITTVLTTIGVAIGAILDKMADAVESIPGIGEAVAGKIREAATGAKTKAAEERQAAFTRAATRDEETRAAADSIENWIVGQETLQELAASGKIAGEELMTMQKPIMSMRTDMENTTTGMNEDLGIFNEILNDSMGLVGDSYANMSEAQTEFTDATIANNQRLVDETRAMIDSAGFESEEGDNANTGGFVTKSGIRRFQGGGVVPGAGNRDTVPALLTPGEVVLNPKRGQSMGTTIGSINITVNTTGGVDGDQLAEEILESIKRRR